MTKTARTLRLAALSILGVATLVASGAEAQPRHRSRTVQVEAAPGPRGEWRRTRRDRVVVTPAPRLPTQPVVVAPPARRRVFVHTAPPPPRTMVRAHAPRQDAVWVEGYWSWNGAQYVWVEGRWERSRPGYVWVQPAWQHDGNGWYFVEGHWAVQPTRPAPPVVPVHPQPSFEADLVSICSQATVGNGALQQCIQSARPLGAYAPQVVAACGAQTVGNGALEDCLRAARPRPDASSIIAACGQATVGNGALVQCVQHATSARTSPVAVIQSCSQATVGNGAFQQCLQASAR